MKASLPELCRTLEQLIVLLDSLGAVHWRNWMQKGHDQLSNGDQRGLDYVLSAYGGMGSLNDFVVSAVETIDGSQVVNLELKKQGDELEHLITTVWSQAHELRRSRTLIQSIRMALPTAFRSGLIAVLIVAAALGAGLVLGLVNSFGHKAAQPTVQGPTSPPSAEPRP
jgi:hypothetical protein